MDAIPFLRGGACTVGNGPNEEFRAFSIGTKVTGAAARSAYPTHPTTLHHGEPGHFSTAVGLRVFHPNYVSNEIQRELNLSRDAANVSFHAWVLFVFLTVNCS
jgi:hypothetical protein